MCIGPQCCMPQGNATMGALAFARLFDSRTVAVDINMREASQEDGVG